MSFEEDSDRKIQMMVKVKQQYHTSIIKSMYAFPPYLCGNRLFHHIYVVTGFSPTFVVTGFSP